MMIRSSSLALVALVVAGLAGCSHPPLPGAPASGEAAARRDGPLERRADSLITRLLATPGRFSSDGHVYAFLTDQDVLDDLTILELHAVPLLIDCVGDDRPSLVTYGDRVTGDTRNALRGAVCFQALVETHFFQMRDDTLLRRIDRSVPCGPQETDEFGDCVGGRYSDYAARPPELRRTQRVWRAYLEEYRRSRRPVLPRLGQTALGCYSLTLEPRPGTGIMDTARHIELQLDSLPLPGTVHPSALRLTDQVTVRGPARWTAHYENRVLVSWGSRSGGAFLGVNVGGSDSALAGYQLYPTPGSTSGILGRVTVTRVRCGASSRDR